MNFSQNCSLTVSGRFHFQESSRAFVPDRSQPGRRDASRRKEPVITCKACQPPENTPGNSSFKSYYRNARVELCITNLVVIYMCYILTDDQTKIF